MQTPPSFEPRSGFIDPRATASFDSTCWPRCNGGEPPPIHSADIHARRCIEFLAAYYQVNCRYAAVDAALQKGASEAEARPLLDAVSRALEDVDALEDRYAPIGFFGEPKMDGVYYRDIHFQLPGLHPPSPVTSSVSSHIAIPGLEDLPQSELEGAPTVFRFSNGKVDL